ncbi:MAG: antitoxin [Clostridium sp.]|nr:antitoxin [Clostridium sp.]
MGKKELIQIRVSEEDKKKIKIISAEKGMTVSEFLLYGAMKVISEDEFIKNKVIHPNT